MNGDFKVDIWDPSTCDWMKTNYNLPLKYHAVAMEVLGKSKVAIRITSGGKVWYITTDQPARNQLTQE